MDALSASPYTSTMKKPDIAELPQPYASPSEVAAYFNVKTETIRAWSKDPTSDFPGALEMHKRMLRYRTSEVLEWEASRDRR